MIVSYQGRTQNLAKWIRELKLNYKVTQYRLNAGWAVATAFETPIRAYRDQTTLSEIRALKYRKTTKETAQQFNISRNSIYRIWGTQ